MRAPTGVFNSLLHFLSSFTSKKFSAGDEVGASTQLLIDTVLVNNNLEKTSINDTRKTGLKNNPSAVNEEPKVDKRAQHRIGGPVYQFKMDALRIASRTIPHEHFHYESHVFYQSMLIIQKELLDAARNDKQIDITNLNALTAYFMKCHAREVRRRQTVLRKKTRENEHAMG
ncbi:hypothetical protein R6242_19505 [Iodobacter sp. CM08]|uniref:hypothetical protein n=1 Tax=Iodobacter sp. CM08 TaxID=3085902 RepID=UPI002980C9B8|nr:hypothetical protein [Iodobacter sp. CM08]MDW5418759.1 hypothetical protein [Iodobacter sp. CM08]